MPEVPVLKFMFPTLEGLPQSWGTGAIRQACTLLPATVDDGWASVGRARPEAREWAASESAGNKLEGITGITHEDRQEGVSEAAGPEAEAR